MRHQVMIIASGLNKCTDSLSYLEVDGWIFCLLL